MSCSSTGGLQQAANRNTPQASTWPQQRAGGASGSSTISLLPHHCHPQIPQHWHQPQLWQWQPTSPVEFSVKLQKPAMDQSHRRHTPFSGFTCSDSLPVSCGCHHRSSRLKQHTTAPQLVRGGGVLASACGGGSGRKYYKSKLLKPLDLEGPGTRCATTTTVSHDRRPCLVD